MLFADVILVVHAIFISFVVFAVPLIIIGKIRHWKWVSNIWFRLAHLFMIAFVALEAVIGMDCPLTIWENGARKSAGQVAYDSGGFISTWLHRLFFYNFPQWIFTSAYIAYALLVFALFYVVPVRKKPT